MSEKERLEQENRAMEERLEALRVTLEKQRAARAGAESKWTSGKQGALSSHVAQLLQQNQTRRAANPKSYRVVNSAESDPAPAKSPARASVAADEPVRSSFAAAVDDWRSSRRCSFETVFTAAHQQRSSLGDAAAMGGGSLLDGPAFDEQESARAFQDAVRAWRHVPAEPESRASSSQLKLWKVPSLPAETEMQTESRAAPVNTTIAFQSDTSLSLMERILLRQGRAAAPAQRKPSQPSSGEDNEDNDDAIEPSESAPGALLAAMESGADPVFNFISGGAALAPVRHAAAETLTVEECSDAGSDGEQQPCTVDEPADAPPAPAPASRPATRSGVLISEFTGAASE